MMIVEILIAIVFAKYGGGLLVSYDEGYEKLLGWSFLLVGVAIAAFAGSSAHAASVVKSPYVLQYVPSPLVNDGAARCKTVGGCHASGFNPQAGFNGIFANQGDVRQYAWNGVSSDNRTIAVLWPIGHDPHITKNPDDWFTGVEGYGDEWEGVRLP